MTSVFFFFLLHASLGLMAMLPFVPAQAGARFFKFCAATAAFMTTAGLGLLLRRFGWPGLVATAFGTTPAPSEAALPGGPEGYGGLVAASLAALASMVLYNRARHFDWSRLASLTLASTLASGAAALVLGAAPGPRLLLALSDATSAWLLGAAAGAMILGHWYLVVLDLPILALRRLTLLLVVGLAVRLVVVLVALVGPAGAGMTGAAQVLHGLFSLDGVFVWMRLLFGLAGPLSLLWFIWKTVEIRSTQSATGILYVQLFLVMAGELLAKHLRVTVGLPL